MGRTRLLITGASGYIGRRLLQTARDAGVEVAAAVRDPSGLASGPGGRVLSFDLAAPCELDALLEGVTGVIHLGVIVREDSLPSGAPCDLNVSGTKALLEAARRCGVRRVVFASSQSAAVDAPTRYGRAKAQIEDMLDGDGEVVVRLGLVSGGPPGGVYGQLYRLCRRFSVLPIVGASAPVYPIHLDDACAIMLELACSTGAVPRCVRAAPLEPTRFGSYLRLLARERLGRRLRVIPVPGRPALFFARLTDRLRLLPPGLGERIAGLAALRPLVVGTEAPNAPLRDVGQCLTAEGQRRRLIAEGRSLTTYVSGGEPGSGVIRRYVRAVMAEEDTRPLDPPWLLQRWPALWRLREPWAGQGGDRLTRRFSLATRIVEMTPRGATQFHSYQRRPRPLAWLALGWLLAVEALLLPVRLIFGLRSPRRR